MNDLYITLVKIKDNTLIDDKYYIAFFKDNDLITMININYKEFLILKENIKDFIELEV